MVAVIGTGDTGMKTGTVDGTEDRREEMKVRMTLGSSWWSSEKVH